MSQLSPTEVRGPYPPCKRPRCSQEDDLQLDQIVSFVAALNMEQINITASVPLEHHTRISASCATLHAGDIKRFQVILSLMNKLAVQPHEAYSIRQTYSSNDICLSSGSTPVANHVCDKSLETALLPRPPMITNALLRANFPGWCGRCPLWTLMWMYDCFFFSTLEEKCVHLLQLIC